MCNPTSKEEGGRDLAGLVADLGSQMVGKEEEIGMAQ